MYLVGSEYHNRFGVASSFMIYFVLGFLIVLCPLFISLPWRYACQCIVINKNVTNMWGIVSEEIILVSIVKHTGYSATVSSRICTRVFIHIGLIFPSHREYLLVEMHILLSLVILGPCGRGEKLGNKRNNKSSETIFWSVPHPGLLVFLVVESNRFYYFSLGNSTVNA